jgi:hypothetical protein
MHFCKLINGFHHEKLWDLGVVHSCAWIFSWLVVLANCRSVQQWSYLQVHCHFGRMQCMLFSRARMNEEFNCETSLDLDLYLVRPALNIAYSSSWRSIIVGCFLHYGPGAGADVLLLLIYWHPMSLLHLFRGLFCVARGYPNFNGYLSILNSEAEVHHFCSCMSVLTDAVCKYVFVITFCEVILSILK